MKEMFDTLKKHKQAQDEFEKLNEALRLRLTELQEFLMDLEPESFGDEECIAEVKKARLDLQFVNDNLLLILNSLHLESAIPSYPKGN